MVKLDALNRRPRHTPTPLHTINPELSQRLITLNDADIQTFEWLQGHGDGTSDRIHAVRGGNPNATDRRLTNLFHEIGRKERGHYLTRPADQWTTHYDHKSYNQHSTYRRTEHSQNALKRMAPDRYTARPVPYSNSFAHDLIRSSITWDIHLACLKNDLHYSYSHAIMDRFNLKQVVYGIQKAMSPPIHSFRIPFTSIHIGYYRMLIEAETTKHIINFQISWEERP